MKRLGLFSLLAISIILTGTLASYAGGLKVDFIDRKAGLESTSHALSQLNGIAISADYYDHASPAEQKAMRDLVVYELGLYKHMVTVYGMPTSENAVRSLFFGYMDSVNIKCYPLAYTVLIRASSPDHKPYYVDGCGSYDPEQGTPQGYAIQGMESVWNFFEENHQ